MASGPVQRDPLSGDMHAAVAGQLQSGEQVLKWFPLDLDADLRFARGWVVLTDRRLLVGEPVTSSTVEGNGASASWTSWPIGTLATLILRDRAGAGAIEIETTDGRRGQWRFTSGRSPA